MKVKVRRKEQAPELPAVAAYVEYALGRIDRQEYARRLEAVGKGYMLQRTPMTDAELLQEHLTPPELTPSPGGRECLGNGHWVGYECHCPDCDFYETVCFPDWEGHRNG